MRFKQVLIIGGVFILILLTIVPSYAQNVKIGYINSQKILTTYTEFINAQKNIDELKNKWEKEVLDMQRQLQQLVENFETQKEFLVESKKAEKQQEMYNLDAKVKEFYQTKLAPGQGEIYRKQEELLAPINEKINSVIEKIGDEQKFDLIFDEVMGNILYANKQSKLNLTDKLLEELDKGSQAKK